VNDLLSRLNLKILLPRVISRHWVKTYNTADAQDPDDHISHFRGLRHIGMCHAID